MSVSITIYKSGWNLNKMKTFTLYAYESSRSVPPLPSPPSSKFENRSVLCHICLATSFLETDIDDQVDNDNFEVDDRIQIYIEYQNDSI